MIVQPATDSGRFRTAMERGRRGPKTSTSVGLKSVNVQLLGDTSINFAAAVGRHAFSSPSLRGVSEMPYALSGRIQSVPQRFLPGSGGDGFAAGMDPLLRLRLTAQIQPLEMGRIAAIRSLQRCTRSWLRSARGDFSSSAAATEIVTHRPAVACLQERFDIYVRGLARFS